MSCDPELAPDFLDEVRETKSCQYRLRISRCSDVPGRFHVLCTITPQEEYEAVFIESSDRSVPNVEDVDKYVELAVVGRALSQKEDMKERAINVNN